MLQQGFNWLINVFLKFLKLKSRDPNIWIFGAWSGRKYADNSKYLFEYVNKHLPEIRAVWITKNPHVVKELQLNGFESHIHYSNEARKLRLNAGFLFFTNGVQDVGKYDLCHGAIKVALWHGMPLKRLCYATNNLRKRNKSLIRYLQYIYLKIYNNTERKVTIASSTKAQDFLMDSFEGNPKDYHITGQPRNDGLFHKDKVENLKKLIGHQAGESFILFMPTHRQTDTQHKSFIDEVIRFLNDDEDFHRELTIRKIKLYIKPHPNRTAKISSRTAQVIILGNDFNTDPQTLMAAADVLITDYSSVFIDYALLNRPVHFYVPDLQEYNFGRNGLFLDFKSITNYWFKDINSFKKACINDKRTKSLGLTNIKKINSIYNEPTLKEGEYSKKVIEIIFNYYCK